MYVCAPCVSLEPKEAGRGSQSPCNRGYRWLWTARRVLRTNERRGHFVTLLSSVSQLLFLGYRLGAACPLQLMVSISSI